MSHLRPDDLAIPHLDGACVARKQNGPPLLRRLTVFTPSLAVSRHGAYAPELFPSMCDGAPITPAKYGELHARPKQISPKDGYCLN